MRARAGVFESHTDHTYTSDSPSLVFSSNLAEQVIRLDFFNLILQFGDYQLMGFLFLYTSFVSFGLFKLVEGSDKPLGVFIFNFSLFINMY